MPQPFGTRLLTSLRSFYRRFAGPEASLSAIPLSLLRKVYGDDYEIRLNGKPFTVNLCDTIVSFEILVRRQYEVFETELFRRIVRAGDNVADVGANIGYFSVLFGELVGPTGRVLAIEPEHNNARLLRKNISARNLDAIVQVRQTAVGATTGTAMLYKAPSGNQGDHRMYENAATPTEHRETISVPIARIDDLVADWPRVDLLKMDIQGFEPQALQGMHSTLSRWNSMLFFTEFWPYGLRGAGEDPIAYLSELRRYGFDLWEISETAHRPIPIREGEDHRFVGRIEPQQGYSNVLCARGEDCVARIRALAQDAAV